MEHLAHIWPTTAELADALACPYQTVAAWKRRGRIPASRDLDLIAAAGRRGHVLTLEDLARQRALVPQPSEDAA